MEVVGWGWSEARKWLTTIDSPPPSHSPVARAIPHRPLTRHRQALPSLKWRHLADVPVQLSKQGVVYHKSAASELDLVSAELIPHWVVNSVLQGQYTQPNSSKISFFLNPHPAGGMAPLPPGVNKLSSSKFLKVHKVAAYVASKLQSEGGEAEPELTLTCNDQVLCPCPPAPTTCFTPASHRPPSQPHPHSPPATPNPHSPLPLAPNLTPHAKPHADYLLLLTVAAPYDEPGQRASLHLEEPW